MIKQFYCIFDKKSDYYIPEFILLENDDVAKRWFDGYLHSVLDSSPNSAIVMYPSDFELRSLGRFDDHVGITDVFDTPRPVVNASSFIIK